MVDVERRLIDNLEITNLINKIICENTQLRFCQIMSILGYELKDDKFYEEPYQTLKHIEKVVKEKKLYNYD